MPRHRRARPLSDAVRGRVACAVLPGALRQATHAQGQELGAAVRGRARTHRVQGDDEEEARQQGRER